jgi:3'(2'), 5'-bisphosphate nucleotidase
VLRYHGIGLAVDEKSDGEPVTRADREASDLIVAGLRRAFPGDVVVSEELPESFALAASAARSWFVDPIDGTQDFVHGREWFAVQVGLAIDGVPRLGVVFQPVGDRLLRAAPAAGAFVEEAGAVRPLRCSEHAALAGIRAVASFSHRSRELELVKEALELRDVLHIGSVGLKAGLLATGERDLYAHPSRGSKAWDTCAPQAILHAAGGRMTDLHGEPLRYADADLRNERGILATNGRLHELVLERLRPLFGS